MNSSDRLRQPRFIVGVVKIVMKTRGRNVLVSGPHGEVDADDGEFNGFYHSYVGS